MSLQTDIIFTKALRSNAALMAMLPAKDVYNTSIALPDVDADNAPTPYIIVTYDGMQEQDGTKDDVFHGGGDTVNIGIEIAAKTRPQLAAIASLVRSTIVEYFISHVHNPSDEDDRLIPSQMHMNAQAVNYDPDKPCYWQVLQYICDTNPD